MLLDFIALIIYEECNNYDKGKGMGKVVPMLFSEYHAMKACWQWRYSSTHYLTSY